MLRLHGAYLLNCWKRPYQGIRTIEFNFDFFILYFKDSLSNFFYSIKRFSQTEMIFLATYPIWKFYVMVTLNTYFVFGPKVMWNKQYNLRSNST